MKKYYLVILSLFTFMITACNQMVESSPLISTPTYTVVQEIPILLEETLTSIAEEANIGSDLIQVTYVPDPTDVLPSPPPSLKILPLPTPTEQTEPEHGLPAEMPLVELGPPSTSTEHTGPVDISDSGEGVIPVTWIANVQI